MAKSVEEILTAVRDIRTYLPHAIEQARVDYSYPHALRGMLRLTLDGNLIGEWGHGICGWCQCESAAWLGSEGQKVYRAAKRVLK